MDGVVQLRSRGSKPRPQGKFLHQSSGVSEKFLVVHFDHIPAYQQWPIYPQSAFKFRDQPFSSRVDSPVSAHRRDDVGVASTAYHNTRVSKQREV